MNQQSLPESFTPTFYRAVGHTLCWAVVALVLVLWNIGSHDFSLKEAAAFRLIWLALLLLPAILPLGLLAVCRVFHAPVRLYCALALTTAIFAVPTGIINLLESLNSSPNECMAFPLSLPFGIVEPLGFAVAFGICSAVYQRLSRTA